MKGDPVPRYAAVSGNARLTLRRTQARKKEREVRAKGCGFSRAEARKQPRGGFSRWGHSQRLKPPTQPATLDRRA